MSQLIKSVDISAMLEWAESNLELNRKEMHRCAKNLDFKQSSYHMGQMDLAEELSALLTYIAGGGANTRLNPDSQ